MRIRPSRLNRETILRLSWGNVGMSWSWFKRREALTPQRVVRCAKRRQKDLDGRMRRFMAVFMRILFGLC